MSLKTLIIAVIYTCLTANANPLKPGGAFTSDDLSKNAFGHPGKSISKSQKNEFFVGNSFFKLSWVAAPASTNGRDGLGPTYNATSCAGCHPLDGRGKAYINDKLAISLLFRIHSLNSSNVFGENSIYGGQFNPFAIDNVPNEGKPTLTFSTKTETYADGTAVKLKKPEFSFESLTFGAPVEASFISPRIGAQLIGLGLLEAIPESAITANEDVLDSNNDGISGRRSIVFDIRKNDFVLGRFGWKAEQPTVEQQIAGAFIGDIGITSSLFPQQNCPIPQTICANSTHGGEPELDEKILQRVTTYVNFIAVPKSRHVDVAEFEKGLAVFKTVGCASCHTPHYSTSGSSVEALNGSLIYPFTDLLLHDMGDELSDIESTSNILAFVDISNAREWRTPPLWGIGLIPTVNAHQQLMHDGRAENVEQAILWHGGEGETSKTMFQNLSADERKILIDFVNKL